MNRLDAMTGLINYRLSKTVNNQVPIKAMIRGVPIYIGAGDKYQEGATGIFDSGFLANIVDAIQQTGADIETLRNEVYTSAQFGYPATRDSQLARDYYVNVIIPFLKDWNNFASKHTHGWGKFADNWVVLGGLSTWNSLNQYRRRLLDIRQSSSDFIGYKSPEPAGPSINMAQRLADQAAAAAKATWGVLKWVIIVVTIAVGILAVIYIGGAM